jgi:hypothetical protein
MIGPGSRSQQHFERMGKQQEALRGSAGPAGPCRRITLADIAPAAPSHQRAALAVCGMVTSGPELGAPRLAIVSKATLRQRRKRWRDPVGQRPITATPDFYAFSAALIASGRLPERECLNNAKVAAEMTEVANEWSLRWWET